MSSQRYYYATETHLDKKFYLLIEFYRLGMSRPQDSTICSSKNRIPGIRCEDTKNNNF